MPNPLTPLSANTQTPSTPMAAPSSPSRLPQKVSSVSKIPGPSSSGSLFSNSDFSSPFSPGFSPVASTGIYSRGSSKMNIKYPDFDDGDVEMFGSPIRGGGSGGDGDPGDDSISSNFSDVTMGAYGMAIGNPPGTPENKSPSKSRPQTPTHNNGPPRSPGKTPATIRPEFNPHNLSHMQPLQDNSPQTPNNKHNQTSNLLLDFTTQFNAISRSNFPPNQSTDTPTHRRTRSASPNKNSPSKQQLPPATPTENRFFNLLDFSPGPLATPRSVPSITPREVESLKAAFASQISQLRAELSGREVEINGLREAVHETESRCAGMNHAIKEQSERFDEERAGWKNMRREMGELFETEKTEKIALAQQLEEKTEELKEKAGELERLQMDVDAARKEFQDMRRRVTDAEAEIESARTEVISARQAAANAAVSSAPRSDGTSPDIQAEVEKVAKELHALYKAKHESKVTALKKSYEARWEKKVAQLQTEITAITRKNEDLQRITTESRDMSAASSKEKEKIEKEMNRFLSEYESIRQALETERKEKGDLVGAVEELLSIQASSGAVEPAVEERARGSLRRASGFGIKTFDSAKKEKNNSSTLKAGIERMGMGLGREEDEDWC